MARNDVIREISSSLAGVISREAGRQMLAVETVQGPPDAAFFARGRASIAVYLYELRVDPRENRDREEIEEEIDDPSGPIVVVRPPPLAVKLRYAVAACGADPLEEQALLALALKAFHEEPVLRDETAKGADIPIEHDETFTLERQVRLLKSLGVAHHPLIGVRVQAELWADRELRRSRRVERRTIDVIDSRHRPSAARRAD